MARRPPALDLPWRVAVARASGRQQCDSQ